MDEESFGPLLDLLPDAVLVVDTTGTLHAANATASTHYGWTLEQWLGESLLELIHPDDLTWALSSLSTIVGKERGSTIELRVKASDGWRLVELIGTPFERDGKEFILLAVRDLTERRKWEVGEHDTELFRSLMQYSASLTLLTDRDGIVTSASGGLARTTGLWMEQVLDNPLSETLVPADRPILIRTLAALRADSEHTATIEVRMRSRDGGAIPCQLTIVDLTDDPTVQGLVISGHDISQLHEARQELEHNARHDSMTGLPNRTRLVHELERRLSTADRRGSTLVAFIDLDRFKPVNDLYGHDAGDELLVAVGRRLQEAVREEDLVARFGGDEFVVVADGQRGDQETLANRLRSALRPHFDLAVGPLRISASIGVIEAAQGSDPGAVLSEADAAMYAEKDDRSSARGNRPVATRRELADRLTQALDDREIVPHYQPIVRLDTGEWVGTEALARWNHPERGLLLPGDFLDVIEDTGRTGRLGEVILATVVDDMGRLRATTGATPAIAINASATEIADDGYPTLISRTLRAGGIDPHRLTVELSEREVLHRPDRQGSVIPTSLAALADAGVRLAVDDFGTGYSSLMHLVSFPIGVLKIDRSFVAGVVHDPQRRSVVAALAGLANATGMDLVAEGVEQQDQIRVLRELGCTLAQGFYFARPMPYGELEVAYRTEVPLRVI